MARGGLTASFVVILAFLVGASARAQTTSQSGYGNPAGSQAAQDFYASQSQATKAAATATDVSIVPQASGSTSDLQSLGASGQGLSSAGQTASGSSTLTGLLGSSAANSAGAGLTGQESWLTASQAIAANPQSTLGASGAPAQTCTSTTSQQTTTTQTGVYTCETTTEVVDTTQTCVQSLIVDTKTVYSYQCTNTYDQVARTWVISTACQALNTNRGCTPTGTACSAPAKPYFQAKQCTAGTVWTSTTQSCTETRTVLVAVKYNYQCKNIYDSVARTWTTSAACAALAGSSACTQQAETCSQPTPPLTKSCQQSTATTAAVCDPTYQVTVGWNYVYNAHRLWNGTTWAPDTAEAALQAAGSVCRIQATNCTGSSNLPPTYHCTTGYSTEITTPQCLPRAADPTSYSKFGGTAPYTYLYSGIFTIGVPASPPISGNIPAAAVGAVVLANTNGNCTVPSNQTYSNTGAAGGAYTVYAYYVMCQQPITALNTPGATAKIVNPAFCASTTPASYLKCDEDVWWNEAGDGYTNASPGAGKWAGSISTSNFPVFANTSLSCRSQPASCTKVSADGQMVTLSCSSTTTEPGCSPPAGMTLQSQTCAAIDPVTGQCSATTYTYTDPTGGCSTWTDQWLCSADIPGADPYASATPYIASQGWSNACQALTGNAACTLVSDTVTGGAETRTINGMAVYETAWARHVIYACPTPTPVDTCTGQVAGCTQTAAYCNATGPDGACTLYGYTYSCPNYDGSGGCEQESFNYQCTEDIPAADPAVSTTPYIVSDSLSTECNGLASNAACGLSGETTDGTSTRTIGGLQVSEPFWSKTDTYVCWSSQPIDGCSGNVTGCTQSGKTCTGNDKNGQCSVWLYTYACPADDGSGNCSVKTETFTCASDVPPADPAVSVVTTETGSHWDTTCPQAQDVDCHNQGTVCNDANSTKTVAGIQVTASCWQQTSTFSCEDKGASSDDCNPPAGCTKTSDRCLDDPPAPDGHCAMMDHVYACPSTSTTSATTSTCQSQLCIGQQCFSISGSSDSSNLGKAYSALATAQVAGQNYADPTQNLLIMSGAAYRCRRSALGFSNCCNDTGWGQDIGLASCDDQEKQLGQLKTAKSCHYVGDYCSNRAFFGACLEKSQRYCCFEGSLARIVNEAGRPQVSKTWGSAKTPDCSGFTVAQFQQLDLSNVDFSDFYASTLSSLSLPGQASTTSSIQQTLNQLYSSESPTNLTPGTTP